MRIRKRGWKTLRKLEKQGLTPTMYAHMKSIQAMVKAGFTIDSIKKEFPRIPDSVLIEYLNYK